MTVDCRVVREALSAGYDGERPSIGPQELGEHLDGCLACRRWRDAAVDLNRVVRVQLAEDREPPASLVAAAAAAMPSRRRWPAPLVVRYGLLVVGLVQIAVTIPLLAGAHHDGVRDLGSFDLALAVGFVAAAMAPRRAAGMQVIVGTAALLLVGAAAIDIATDRTRIWEETPHLLALCGWLLIRYLAGRSPERAGPSDLTVRSSLQLLLAGRVRAADAPHDPGVPATGRESAQALDPAPSEQRMSI